MVTVNDQLRPQRRAFWRLAGGICAILVAGVAAGGCGMSSLTSGLSGGMFGGSQRPESGTVSREQLLSAAKSDFRGPTGATPIKVSHGCPRFQVWSRDNNVTIYETGRAGDQMAVMHRGEITQTARECSIAPGQVTVKYGFSGRVLMGPKGTAGRITLPVHVFVTDAKRERIVTDKSVIDVEISLDKPIGYFSLVRTVTFKIPEGTRPGEYEVFVGFERNIPGAG